MILLTSGMFRADMLFSKCTGEYFDKMHEQPARPLQTSLASKMTLTMK